MKTKLIAAQSVFLVITAAVVISGTIAPAGSIVEVTEGEAKDLLARGKARLATAEDGVDLNAVSSAGQEGGGAAGGGEEQVALSKLNKAQLVEAAKALGVISVGEANTKAEIIAAIEAAKAAQ